LKHALVTAEYFLNEELKVIKQILFIKFRHKGSDRKRRVAWRPRSFNNQIAAGKLYSVAVTAK